MWWGISFIWIFRLFFGFSSRKFRGVHFTWGIEWWKRSNKSNVAPRQWGWWWRETTAKEASFQLTNEEQAANGELADILMKEYGDDKEESKEREAGKKNSHKKWRLR
jgi:hypothetical protein